MTPCGLESNLASQYQRTQKTAAFSEKSRTQTARKHIFFLQGKNAICLSLSQIGGPVFFSRWFCRSVPYKPINQRNSYCVWIVGCKKNLLSEENYQYLLNISEQVPGNRINLTTPSDNMSQQWPSFGRTVCSHGIIVISAGFSRKKLKSVIFP